MSEKESNNKGGLAERLIELLGLRKNTVNANLVRFLAIGLALGMVFLNVEKLFGVREPSAPPPQGATEVMARQDGLSVLERALERKLEEQLSLIAGAGQVRAKVSLASGHTQVPVINERVQETRTDEQAGDKSTRTSVTTQRDQTHVIYRGGTVDVMAVMKELRPEIAGVQIVAQGAASDKVRAELHEAAVRLLSVGAHRVDVKPTAADRR